MSSCGLQNSYNFPTTVRLIREHLLFKLKRCEFTSSPLLSIYAHVPIRFRLLPLTLTENIQKNIGGEDR